MLFYYNNELLSGIYEIINQLNGKRYIGSTKEFKLRWKDHVYCLKRNRHHNKHLQYSFNKSSEEVIYDDFLEFRVLEILENSTKKERLIKEEFWINFALENGIELYNSNLEPTKEPKNRSCFSLTPEETRKKISENSKKNWENEEFRKNQLEVFRKRWEQPEAKEKAIEALNKRWAEDGRREDYGNKIKILWQTDEYRKKLLIQRRSQESIERFKKNCSTPEARDKKAKTQTKNHGKIISPSGEVFEVIGLRQFCLDHNIPLSSLRNLQKVMNGKTPSVYGWRKYSEDLIGTKYVNKLNEEHFHARNFKLLSPEGIVYEGTNVTKFCKEHGLQQQNITKVLLGKRKSHLGWTSC